MHPAKHCLHYLLLFDVYNYYDSLVKPFTIANPCWIMTMLFKRFKSLNIHEEFLNIQKSLSIQQNFIVNFEHISHLVLVFLLLTLNM